MAQDTQIEQLWNQRKAFDAIAMDEGGQILSIVKLLPVGQENEFHLDSKTNIDTHLRHVPGVPLILDVSGAARLQVVFAREPVPSLECSYWIVRLGLV